MTMSGFGQFDGDYFIKLARHHLSRSRGFSTELEIRSTSEGEIELPRRNRQCRIWSTAACA